MSLTDKAAAEQKWGWLPTLRLILETKRIPDRYFGPSSASDNIFDRMQRLMEIAILINENRTEIIERLGGDSCDQTARDLVHLQNAFQWVQGLFGTAIEEIQEIKRAVTCGYQASRTAGEPSI